MKNEREFEQKIKPSEIQAEYFYRAIAILGISLSDLSRYKGKSHTYFSKRRNLGIFNEFDSRTLKQYCDEKFGAGVFEDKIYQASLDFKNYKHTRQSLINELEDLRLENERLNAEIEMLKEDKKLEKKGAKK